MVFVDIDLDQCHLPKALADFGGHYMRSDLIRLLVDTRRKEPITHADQNGQLGKYSTSERVGLNMPLGEEKKGGAQAVPTSKISGAEKLQGLKAFPKDANGLTA